MVKPRRIEIKNGFYHIYNRFVDGHKYFNRQTFKKFKEIFIKNADYFNIEVLILTCMPNHFHGIIQLHNLNLSRFLQKYGTNFARYINIKKNRKGHVFQNRHKTKLLLTDKYFLSCLAYIIYNPVKAGLVKSPEQYPLTTLKDILIENNDPKFDIIYKMFHQNRSIGKKIFKEWMYSAKALEHYEKFSIDFNRQIEGDNIEKKYIFSRTDRRKKTVKSKEKRRKEDFYKKLDVKQINKIINKNADTLFPYVKKNKIWKTKESFIKHIRWYLLRHYAKLTLKEIAILDKIHRHTTISDAINSIKNNNKKMEILKHIIEINNSNFIT